MPEAPRPRARTGPAAHAAATAAELEADDDELQAGVALSRQVGRAGAGAYGDATRLSERLCPHLPRRCSHRACRCRARPREFRGPKTRGRVNICCAYSAGSLPECVRNAESSASCATTR